MARSGVLLEAATSYYGNLVTNALTLMRSTQEDLRTGQFGVSKTVGGVVSYWLDAYEGWWSALLVTASAPLPTAFLRLGPGETTDSAIAYVLVPGDERPEWTDLGLVGDTGTIGRGNLVVEANKDGNCVQVKLKGLEPAARARLASGLYQGLVHKGAKPLAIIMVRVDPAGEPKAARTAAAKSRAGARQARQATSARSPRRRSRGRRGTTGTAH
jgi:hypothetical protein